MKKSGITMTSIMVYVALFFIFTSVSIAISSNMNYRTLSQKGEMIANEEIQKLQFNLFYSAKRSKFVEKINDRIVFSNNDSYFYDIEKQEVRKNETVLLRGVSQFEIVEDNMNRNDRIKIHIKVEKYHQVEEKTLFFILGEDENEK